MKVLVTGAAGRLGSVVCQELVQLGHDVLPTDLRPCDAGPELRKADLRDPQATYLLLEGCDAVVHLGNIPHLSRGASPQAVLSENVAMNANVFRAAVDLGVTRIVFASSLQAMIRLEDGKHPPAPYTIPYFPLDGDAPANPGDNFYGLSKEFGERMLRVLCERHTQLHATALRYPMLTGKAFEERALQPLPLSALNFAEGLTYLDTADAARLVGLVLARQQPGYHQYFPAQALAIAGLTAAEIRARFFSQTRLRTPGAEPESLVDGSALWTDVAFRPAPPLTIQLQRS
jgi:nucleoside-diphosphate-sugar epimerase